MSNAPAPVGLKSVPDGLEIAWSDGVTHRLAWRLLRERCPCATCRAKRAEPVAEPDPLAVIPLAEARPLGVRGMKPMGNYAYAIDFTDGHNTGIYTLEFLRSLGDAGPPR